VQVEPWDNAPGFIASFGELISQDQVGLIAFLGVNTTRGLESSTIAWIPVDWGSIGRIDERKE